MTNCAKCDRARFDEQVNRRAIDICDECLISSGRCKCAKFADRELWFDAEPLPGESVTAYLWRNIPAGKVQDMWSQLESDGFAPYCALGEPLGNDPEWLDPQGVHLLYLMWSHVPAVIHKYFGECRPMPVSIGNAGGYYCTICGIVPNSECACTNA